jgi:hypothetical protein
LGASNRARSITVKGRKRKDSAGENVEAYRHETETRKNVVWTGKVEKQKTHPLKFQLYPSISMKE